MKLYDLTQNYINLMELLDNEEVPAEMLKASLDSVEEDLNEKYENIGKLIAEVNHQVAALKSEEERLYAKRKVLENRVASIKNYLFENMKAIGYPKVNTGLFNFTIRKNAASVKVLDESLIPSDYFQAKFELSKKLLLEKLKSGELIEGAELQQTESLMIK